MVAGPTKKTFIIAEAGVNHNGRLDFALEMVDIAAKAGADAIKFQTFSAEHLVLPGTAKASYQIHTTSDADQYSMLKNLELPKKTYELISKKCRDVNIEFMSTAFDESNADFLMNLGITRIKIPSGEITNKPFLEFLARKDLPIILSTGMSSLNEIRDAIDCIESARLKAGYVRPIRDIVTILHCTSSYPAPLNEVNLNVMKTLSKEFNFQIGYSDHTLGSEVAIAAVALGATVIEKHFTLDCSLQGPDHKASLSPTDLLNFVQKIRNTEYALGGSEKFVTNSEFQTRDLVRRSIVTARDLRAGEILTKSDFIMLRPGTGISPMRINDVLEKTPNKNIKKNKILQWGDLF